MFNWLTNENVITGVGALILGAIAGSAYVGYSNRELRKDVQKKSEEIQNNFAKKLDEAQEEILRG